MDLPEETKHKISQAHFVRGIKPEEYKVIYRNFYELLEYREHLQPDNVYIVFYPDEGEHVELTYSQFKDKVFRTANLLKQNGIGHEDRVSTVSHNHLNTVIQYFAAWSIGATVVPINVNEEPERIKYILKSSNTKLAFIKHDYFELFLSIKDDLPNLEKLFVHSLFENQFNPVPKDIEIFEEILPSQSNTLEPDNSVNQETEALIVYTSGTTGLPKGVILTQYNLLVDADGIAKWHGMEKGQVMMCVLPIHHVNGTVVTMITPMYYGGRTVLNQRFHTHTFFKRLAHENVQVVSVVPTLLQFLCHDFETSTLVKDTFREYEQQLSKSFRHIICGAGPLTCELALKFEDMFKLKIVHGYGLSETTCYSCFLPIELGYDEHTNWLRDYGFPSIGVEIEHNEMDIHDSHGNRVAEGERGEIVIRGHNVMKYYDQNPEANASTFEFGWFRSGDEGFYRTDEKGRKFFFITGRIKELIIRGGTNIAPLEIDEVLMGIFCVKAGIAVGFDNEWYGEEVGALVQLKEDALNSASDVKLKQEILNHCRSRLPFYKSPKVIIFSDTIPVTSTGKYQRNKAKHLFEKYRSVQFREVHHK